MVSHKKDFDDLAWDLTNGIEEGLWKFTDAVAGFIDSLSDKTILALEELDRGSVEKNLAVKNAGMGTVFPVSPGSL
jgi:hypothetical protein